MRDQIHANQCLYKLTTLYRATTHLFKKGTGGTTYICLIASHCREFECTISRSLSDHKDKDLHVFM
jgi:hypothetical protein